MLSINLPNKFFSMVEYNGFSISNIKISLKHKATLIFSKMLSLNKTLVCYSSNVVVE